METTERHLGEDMVLTGLLHQGAKNIDLLDWRIGGMSLLHAPAAIDMVAPTETCPTCSGTGRMVGGYYDGRRRRFVSCPRCLALGLVGPEFPVFLPQAVWRGTEITFVLSNCRPRARRAKVGFWLVGHGLPKTTPEQDSLVRALLKRSAGRAIA